MQPRGHAADRGHAEDPRPPPSSPHTCGRSSAFCLFVCLLFCLLVSTSSSATAALGLSRCAAGGGQRSGSGFGFGFGFGSERRRRRRAPLHTHPARAFGARAGDAEETDADETIAAGGRGVSAEGGRCVGRRRSDVQAEEEEKTRRSLDARCRKRNVKKPAVHDEAAERKDLTPDRDPPTYGTASVRHCLYTAIVVKRTCGI